MTTISELVKRLKELDEEAFYGAPATAKALCEQAARAIEALEAEREKWQRLAKAGGAKCTPEPVGGGE